MILLLSSTARIGLRLLQSMALPAQANPDVGSEIENLQRSRDKGNALHTLMKYVNKANTSLQDSGSRHPHPKGDFFHAQ